MKKQRYLVITPSHGGSGGPSFDFTTEMGLSKYNTFADFLSVYPVGAELTMKDKEAFGMLSQKQYQKNTK